ncbi:C6 zinc finger domain protein [Aspergillus pseudonomiae]|uniref:C6 zinc finger domain protein n=1 Tax=Aspergillus pseudonomiae TaxID=1506151 RepID=A0A5N7DD74_9EURO|nr:C6 zinc finger domain protein [Aspergillus pseudonomiae]KAE8404352.1 C6 zinc finger domain protein [Aspergillus pseudonomiae]
MLRLRSSPFSADRPLPRYIQLRVRCVEISALRSAMLSTTTPTLTMKPTRTDRQRAGGKRSRTGCRTCRARHIKCDEAPGSCQNCTSSGRRCDGYDLYRLPVKGRTVKGPTTQVQVEILNGFRWKMTSDERRCLSYFQNHTIPTLLGLFDSTLWEKLVFQISQSEPAVYHAVVALSAIHYDSEAKGMLLPMDQPRNTWHQFALEQLSRAFNLLTKRRTSQDPRFCNVTLVCCLLFVLSDLLCGHYDNAFSHLQSGIRILQGLQAHRQLIAPTPREELVEQSLVAAFAHLDTMSTHFGVGGPLLCIENELSDRHIDSDSLMPFQSLQDVLRVFEPYFSMVFQFISPCMYRPPDHIGPDYEALHRQQLETWSHFSQFIRQFKQFYSNMYNRLSRAEQRGADLVDIWITGLSVALKTCLVGGDIAVLDCYTPDYRMVVILTEAFLQKYPERPSISIQCGIIPPLFHTAFACRDYTVRWQAMELLWYWPHREGPFDSNWCVSLASQTLKLELQTCLATGQLPDDTTPIVTNRAGQRLSAKELVAIMTHHQQKMRVSSTNRARDASMVDGEWSPLDLLESVKCMSRWSCVRAFNAFAAQMEAYSTIAACSAGCE